MGSNLKLGTPLPRQSRGRTWELPQLIISIRYCQLRSLTCKIGCISFGQMLSLIKNSLDLMDNFFPLTPELPIININSKRKHQLGVVLILLEIQELAIGHVMKSNMKEEGH